MSSNIHYELSDNIDSPEGFNDTDIISIPSKYRSTVSNILLKHCSEIKIGEDEIIQPMHSISKKRLKELITKHNNELFSFMKKESSNDDKSVLDLAETIFRRYGYDIPTIKGTQLPSLHDLKLDISVSDTIKQINDNLKKNNGSTLDDFIKQYKWILLQYRTIGEEILRLEGTLHKKLETLDKIQSRVPMITNLINTPILPELIDTFSKYIDDIFKNSQIKEVYLELIDAYKKWNIFREIISYEQLFKPVVSEPTCSICLNESITQALVPCGHTFCSSCSRKQQISCYICRSSIRERIKVYLT